MESNIVKRLEHRFGEFDIDLFASLLNAQCNKYCAWKLDPNAEFIDAFSKVWNNFNNPYAFPPFSVLAICLQKITQERARVLLIAPVWPTQVWFPKMMRMLIAPPVILPLGVLSLPFKKEMVHKQHKTLRLMACHLSGQSSLSGEFRKSLSTSSAHPGEIPQNLNIGSILRNGYISVIDGVLIPCCTMK